MTSIMRNVVSSAAGTGYRVTLDNTYGVEVAAKTGSTNDDRDRYFVGLTPEYVGACWFGYDNNQILRKSQTGYAKSLWNKAMKVLHENLQIKDFEQPSGIEVLEYCTATGQLATAGCTAKDKGVYKSSNKPVECELHGKNSGSTTTAAEGGKSTDKEDKKTTEKTEKTTEKTKKTTTEKTTEKTTKKTTEKSTEATTTTTEKSTEAAVTTTLPADEPVDVEPVPSEEQDTP